MRLRLGVGPCFLFASLISATVEKLWARAEPVFMNSPDIAELLPEAKKLFDTVDREFMHLTSRVRREMPNVVECCGSMSAIMSRTTSTLVLTESLGTLHGSLEKIHEHLAYYMTCKRQAFGRFYFISDDELLQILTEAQNPRATQRHLLKLFENL